MADVSLRERIEQELARQAGIHAAVEDADGAISLSGRVDSAEALQAAEDIVRSIAPRSRIDNNLEVETEVPAQASDVWTEEPSAGQMPASVQDVFQAGGDTEPNFTDREPYTNPVEAAAPDSWGPEDDVQEGGNPYTPPTDPVVDTDGRGRAQVLGGFGASSMQSIEVEPSASDNRLGDEAITDAIIRELREDAATRDLEVEVVVTNGVAHLRGTVPGMEDAENAEAVAARVPGVREVVDETQVQTV